jgi:hypothetical protein
MILQARVPPRRNATMSVLRQYPVSPGSKTDSVRAAASEDVFLVLILIDQQEIY